MSSNTVDLFVLAGEMSGDMHGAHLIQALWQKRSDLTIRGVAGPEMRKLQVPCDVPMEHLQVMGFFDVVTALPRLMRQFFAIRNHILKLNPQVVICIDYPDFHLRLQQHLRKKGYRGKLVQYICPTVWAWRKERISQMQSNVDLLLSIFPFEKQHFPPTFPIQYTGHPLVIQNRHSKCKREKILALFPGSRKAEIERNFPLQLQVAQKLQNQDPELKIVVSAANRERQDQIDKWKGIFRFECVDATRNQELMAKAYLAIAKSGTVTLELALHQTPTVVIYAIHPFDAWLAQKVFHIRLPFYCIVNLIASKLVYPELIGSQLTFESLLFEAKELWASEEKRKACIQGCETVKALLGTNNASEKAAEEILRLF